MIWRLIGVLLTRCLSLFENSNLSFRDHRCRHGKRQRRFRSQLLESLEKRQLFAVDTFVGSYSQGKWQLEDQAAEISFGLPGDQPVMGDWNGDGRKTPGVFRNGVWVLDMTGNGFDASDRVINFGLPGDQAIAGDWNGDGIDTVGIFRSGSFTFDVNGNGFDSADTIVLSFGLPGDVPVAGDWNGDGVDKVGIFRNGTWVLDVNGNGFDSSDRVLQFGLAGDQPVTGDWNGDGTDTPGVRRGDQWFFDREGDGYSGEQGQTKPLASGLAVAGANARTTPADNSNINPNATKSEHSSSTGVSEKLGATRDKVSVAAQVKQLELSFVKANQKDFVEYDALGRLVSPAPNGAKGSFFHASVKIDKIAGRLLNNPSNIQVNVYWAKGPNSGDIISLASSKTLPVNRVNARPGDVIEFYFDRLDPRADAQPVNATHLIAIIDPKLRLQGEELERGDNVRAQKIASIAELAQQILNNSNITLAPSHTSGKADRATALDNIRDTAAGKLALRSSYEDPKTKLVGPGGQTVIDARTLTGILEVAKQFGQIRVSEIAGGVHGVNSPHYRGLAVDISVLRGKPVINITDKDPKLIAEFRSLANALRAGIQGPYTNGGADKNHRDHFHLQWR